MYYTDDDGESEQISKWVTLEKDKPYYINGTHYEYGGKDYITVAVEIENTDESALDAHSPMFETQRISLQAETQWEKTLFTVNDVDKGGEYMLIFSDMNLKKSYSSKIQVSSTAEEFYEAVKSFYDDTLGTDIVVTREAYDVEETLLT
eukprot:CAMPEP_0170506134 /NCGR_PEP_ID=MMETSP0208-20121228/53754_1 /TAXON_ID=197538 /ORGANISM="Strombidium inclinatum, Strain S3" /LENGTH=147 /DNA_ID=CAMNT_0010787459 /DNA_START=459 /DNA_END=898 /DNA_ORIENTATION=-